MDDGRLLGQTDEVRRQLVTTFKLLYGVIRYTIVGRL